MMQSYLVLAPIPGLVVGQFAELTPAQALTYAKRIAARGAFATASPAAASPTLALAALDAATQAKEAAGILFQALAAEKPAILPTDVSSQGKLLSAFVAAGAGLWQDGTPWRMGDGSFVPMTAADVQVAAGHALAYVAGCAAAEAKIAPLVTADPATNYSASPFWPSQGPFSTKATLAPKADDVTFDASFAVERPA